MPVLELAQLGQPLGHEAAVDGAVEAGGVACPSSGENGKNPPQSSCGLLDEARAAASWSSSVSPG